MGKFLQTATYWAPLSVNKFGEQTFSPPVNINVRWEEKNRNIYNKK